MYFNDGIIAIGAKRKSNLIELFDKKKKSFCFLFLRLVLVLECLNFLALLLSDEIFEKDIKVLHF